jgi:uncharacterized protein (DUF2141 family)
MKPKLKRAVAIILISIVLTLACLFLHFRVITAADLTTIQHETQANSFRISGTLNLRNTNGTIHITVVDQEHFDIPQSGLDTLVLQVNSKRIRYEFSNIPKGTYGIRCFQDLNGNGKLDKGLFGPSEPWALSWRDDKRFPPRFKDISFDLHMDKEVNLTLKK